MNFLKLPILILFVLLILCTGCSTGHLNNITTPGNITDESLPVVTGDEIYSGHELLGIWTLNFDPSSMKAEITEDRSLAAHYNLTSVLRPSIHVNSYDSSTGILDVDVTINNAYAINGYDLRLVLFTDAAGHFMENWDDFTNLYDIPGGNIINPFKAYAKDQPNRKFAALTQHTENLRIYIPAGNFSVQTAIDACFPSNCTEPYSIDNFSQGTLLETAGASAPVSINVSDWQNNVNGVYLYCPVITGGPLVSLVHGTGASWSGTLTNTNGVSAGQWAGYIVAYSGSTALYDLIVIQINKATPQFQEVLTLGGVSYDSVNSIASDSDDNIYLAGYFYETVDFDPGSGVHQKSSLGIGDGYLLKLNSSREFQWVQVTANETDAVAWCVHNDRNQYIYLLGTFNGICDFDPSPSVDLHGSSGYYDNFVSKYDMSGNWIWTKTFGGGSFDRAVGMDTDSSGNIYISGHFQGTIDFDPSAGTYEVSSRGYQDNYIVKFDSDGILQWADVFGSIGGETPYEVYIGPDSTVVCLGQFGGTIDFDPGPDIMNRTPSGLYSLYIISLDLDGIFKSVLTINGDDMVNANRFIYDPSKGYLIAGSFDQTADFNPGSGIDSKTANGSFNAFISRYDTSLNYRWTINYGNPESQVDANDVAFDSSGGVLIGGSWYGVVDLDPGSAEYWVEVEMYYSDCYILKLDSLGNFTWAQTWGGPKPDLVRRVRNADNGLIYAFGEFYETVDFDPGSGVVEKTSNGSNDDFISVFK